MSETKKPSTQPVVLRYEDRWEELKAQLDDDRRIGLTPSIVRSAFENWVDPGSFVEVGTLVRRASSSYSGDGEEEEAVKEVPADALIAGWGRSNGQLVFIAGDDNSLGSAVRGGGGAGKVSRVRDYALEQSAPLVQVFAAARIEPDYHIGAEFARFGYGVDLDFESESAERILKIAIVTDPITEQATLEALWCHVIILVGNEASLNGHGAQEALSLGLADVMVEDLPAALTIVSDMLARFPASCFNEHPRRANDASLQQPAEADSPLAILDAAWKLDLTPMWQESVRTTLGTVADWPIGLIELGEGMQALQGPLLKVLRLCKFCDAFGLPLVIVHGGLDRPSTPNRGDIDSLDQLRELIRGASNPVIEVRRGQRSLLEDLGVRALWSVDLGDQTGADDRADPEQLRSVLEQRLSSLPSGQIRPDQDPRVVNRAPRSLHG